MRMKLFPAISLGLIAIAMTGALPVRAESIAFTGATIYPISSAPIDNGVLLIEDKTIKAVGPAGEISIPDDAKQVDVSGKVVMPGLVDTHSHLGGPRGGDRSGALHPAVRALDSVNIRADAFRKALAGGITTVNVMPGSGLLMSGQTVYLKLRADAETIADWLFCDDPINGICGGMKMANGTNPQGEKPMPGTRAKAAQMVRALFVEAQAYAEKKARAEEEGEDPPAVDLRLEAILEILNGERTVHFHTHRHDDIMTALRLGEEFGFTPVLHHVSEAWKVADEIAAAGAPASIIVLDSPGGKLEATDIRWTNGAALEDAGVLVAFHTDDGITDSRLFLRSAGFGVRAGMSREAALSAMTLSGAKMLELEEQVGSLEPGKDADFIILSGDPLSVYTHVEETWVEGTKVFDLDNPKQRLWATGGYGVFRGDDPAAHHRGGAQ